MADPRITDEMVEAAVSSYFESDETPWHKMRAALSASLSAALPLMESWIPIEGEPDTSKAPWDGKSYLFINMNVQDTHSYVGFWGKWECSHNTALDISESHIRASCCGRFTHPTHWMPHPPAPKEG